MRAPCGYTAVARPHFSAAGFSAGAVLLGDAGATESIKEVEKLKARPMGRIESPRVRERRHHIAPKTDKRKRVMRGVRDQGSESLALVPDPRPLTPAFSPRSSPVGPAGCPALSPARRARRS